MGRYFNTSGPNITGIIQDNANPFNIADNFDIPYFTEQEVFELYEQHEIESGQLFNEDVKKQVTHITAGQPGLINGFALLGKIRCGNRFFRT